MAVGSTRGSLIGRLYGRKHLTQKFTGSNRLLTPCCSAGFFVPVNFLNVRTRTFRDITSPMRSSRHTASQIAMR